MIMEVVHFSSTVVWVNLTQILLVLSVQALSREKCLDKIAWLFHWAIENWGA